MTVSRSINLPDGFSALEAFVDRWAGNDTMERLAAREESTMSEIRMFYDTMLGYAEQAAVLINQHPLDKIPDDVALLCKLMLALCHAAVAIEVLNNPRVATAPYPTGVRVVRGLTPYG